MRSTLDHVVPDGCGGPKCFVDITYFNLSPLLRVICPDACIAVGLEFESDRKLIVLSLCLDLSHSAEQILNVMSNLMRDHVGLGEIARSLEFILEFAEKRKIQIELLVAGTIKWAHRCIRPPARRRYLSVEKNQRWLLIVSSGLGGENLAPSVLGTGENGTRELTILIGRLICCIACSRRLSLLRYSAFKQLARIAAEEADDRRKNQNADPAPAQGHSASHATTIFNISALPLVSPAHLFSPKLSIFFPRDSILTLLLSADKEMTLDEWQAGGEYFENTGLKVFYRRSGPGNEPVLCLHGFPAASFDYHKIWHTLSAHFDLLAFDMAGYGFSSKPRAWGYTTFDQVDVLQDLIAHLGIGRVHILAHDYGNTITQELLVRDSEGRLNFEIASICFLNGALFPETHRPIFAQKLLISPLGAILGRLIPDAVFKRNLSKVFGPDTKPTESELDDFVTLFKYNNGKRIAHRLIRYMTERAKYRERWVGPLQQMTQPFRFINGLADPVSGLHLVERFREIVPQQKDIVELSEIGHFPHLECPDAVAAEYLAFRDRISHD